MAGLFLAGALLAYILRSGFSDWLGNWRSSSDVVLCVAVLFFLSLAHEIQFSIAARRLRERADIDGLTGPATRRRFIDMYRQIQRTPVHASQRSAPPPVTLALIDVDYFKHVNDNHGHHAGDHVPAEIAKLMLACCQEGRDVAGRMGGEELALLLVDCSEARAGERIEQLRADIEARIFASGASGVRVTISMGMITRSRPDMPFDAMFREADAACIEPSVAAAIASRARSLPDPGVGPPTQPPETRRRRTRGVSRRLSGLSRSNG